ncbi:Chromosome partition protein Smc [Sporosarcina sp. ANT_H38]|uniref:YkyA family protein n=1 Tax=Sporosarcina sp. ANT_H38 TaxID=2597358 RepID=UPI00165DC820|nr:YkyA family protein [Sporosarcina sp. ANT_H38]
MKKSSIGFVLAVTLVLFGCSSNSSIEKQLSTTMAKMNSAEKVSRDAQGELTELEKLEQELFYETMELSHEQLGEVKIKVTELEELLGQRLAQIKGEEKSIRKATKSMDELDVIIEQVDGDVKKSIEELKIAVSNRYELHSSFVVEYKKLTSLQKELYEMLVVVETRLMGLEDKVGEVNAQNEVVRSAVTSFNDATLKVNTLKDAAFVGLQDEE